MFLKKLKKSKLLQLGPSVGNEDCFIQWFPMGSSPGCDTVKWTHNKRARENDICRKTDCD